MRTKHELGLILFDNQDYFDTGLCKWVDYLEHNELITKKEKNFIQIKVDASLYKKVTGEYCPYAWEKGEIQPRLQWISDNLIDKEKLYKAFIDNQDLFNSGLCYWTSLLEQNSKITELEENYLDWLINNNEPTKKWYHWLISIEEVTSEPDWHYWTKDKIKPRLKWLKKHLHV